MGNSRATVAAAGVAVAAALLMASAGAWETARSTVADGLRIAFSVMSAFAFDPDHQERAGRNGLEQPHRVAVQLTEPKSGRQISEAEVDLIVTGEDYASGPLAMRKTSGGGRIYFEAVIPGVPLKALYQVDVRLSGSPRVTSVHFDYRHGR